MMWMQKLKIAHGIANGCAFLHKNKVCHRDLKSPNVLYNASLQVKLCDFAFSKWKAEASRNFSSSVGTPGWMAPEVLRGGDYGFGADIWGYGEIPTLVLPSPHALPGEVVIHVAGCLFGTWMTQG